METGYPGVVATLVVLADCTVSLYLSKGSSIIGAGQHPAVHQSADAFLRAAESLHSQLEPISVFPPPSEGETRFYLRTFEVTLGAVAEDRALGEGRHALSPLFYAAHVVIARIREASEARRGRRA